MTIIGRGGVVIKSFDYLERFRKDFSKLTPEMQELVHVKIKDLLKNPRPPGLRFEKLKGITNPSVYSIHVTGNYKISFEIIGDCAMLRRVANHDTIDRSP